MNLQHADVGANDVSIHTVSIGDGSLVVFCHGFPESWYSWRHQLAAVAAAGFRAVAMDMRGYGQSSAPAGIGAYTLSHLVADVVGVVAALGAARARGGFSGRRSPERVARIFATVLSDERCRVTMAAGTFPDNRHGHFNR